MPLGVDVLVDQETKNTSNLVALTITHIGAIEWYL